MPAKGELIGQGKEAEVRAFGTHAVKLYAPSTGPVAALREGHALAVVAALGLPVPRLIGTRVLDQSWGLVMERLRGPTMAAMMMTDEADAVPDLLDEMVALQARLHAAGPAVLPSIKAKMHRAIIEAAKMHSFDIKRALDRLETLADGYSICHGDFHPFNIIRTGTGWVVIDWLDSGIGPSVADYARSALLLGLKAPDLAHRYLDCVLARGLAEIEQIEAWMPLLALARLSERAAGEVEQLQRLAAPLF